LVVAPTGCRVRNGLIVALVDCFQGEMVRNEDKVADAVTDLEQLVRQDLLGKLGPDPSGELAAMPLGDLLIVYLNWRFRFVPARSRAAYLSSELLTSPKYPEHRAAIDTIVTKIKAGGDLSPHLSKRASTAYEPTRNRKASRAARKDLDLLLSEWNIHHLHLSTAIGPDGYVGRTKDLLFANFQHDDAYLIAIYSHGDWTMTDLGLISIRNWPDAGIFRKLQGVLGLAEPVAETELPALRNAGLTTLLELDDAVYAPAGQSTAGTSIAASTWSINITHALRRLRDTINDRERLTEIARGAGVELATDIRWVACSQDGWYGVRDARSGFFFTTVPLSRSVVEWLL
jgi:hypothetical protein